MIQLPGRYAGGKAGSRALARRYLVGRQVAQNGLKDGQIAFAARALLAIIRDYTR